MVEHFHHDKEIVVEGLGLGPLGGVQHIFQGQRMKAEMPADMLHDGDVVNAVDIDPGGGGRRQKGQRLFNSVQGSLHQRVCVIVQHGKTDVVRLFFSHVDQGSGRTPGLF